MMVTAVGFHLIHCLSMFLCSCEFLLLVGTESYKGHSNRKTKDHFENENETDSVPGKPRLSHAWVPRAAPSEATWLNEWCYSLWTLGEASLPSGGRQKYSFVFLSYTCK